MAERTTHPKRADLISQDFVLIEPTWETRDRLVAQLEQTVFGQTAACLKIAEAFTRVLAGLKTPHHPEFVGLFLGETGVGKTEMGRAIAHLLNPQNPEAILKIINCCEYQMEHDVERILGSPNSYVGYGDPPVITPEFLAQGRTVIIFDEIEKAHDNLHRLLLRVADEGLLNVTTTVDDEIKNTPLDFSRATIILTSNLGSTEIQAAQSGRALGFQSSRPETNFTVLSNTALKAAVDFWRHMPEFLNRLDASVVFQPLTYNVALKIIDKFLNDYLFNCHVAIAATQELKDWLLQDLSKLNGREIKRKLDRQVIAKAAEVVLKIPPGVPLIADVNRENQTIFWVSQSKLETAQNDGGEPDNSNPAAPPALQSEKRKGRRKGNPNL